MNYLNFDFKITPWQQTAGFEPANRNSEAANFQNYPSGGEINSLPENAQTGTSSYLLNGGYNGQVGLAKSFAVMPGDLVQIEAYAKYATPSSTPADYNNFVMSLLSAFNLSAPAPGEVGTASSAVSAFGNWEVGSNGNINQSDPVKVFVTIVLFDKDYNFLDAAYGASLSSGTLISKSYTVKEPGYAYLYVSNEHPALVDVYFDDVTMSHTPSAVIQVDDYYPFGLQFNSYQRENSTQQNYLFNSGSELESGLDLGWYNTIFRNYDPAIGRFIQVDPLADFMPGINPYHFAYDNPVMYSDPDGLAPMWWLKLRASVKQVWHNATGRGNQHAVIHGRNHGKPVEIGAKTQGRRPNPNLRQETLTSNKPKQKEDPKSDDKPEIPDRQKPPVVRDDKEDDYPEIDKKQIRPGSSVSVTKRIEFIGGEDNVANPTRAASQLDPLVQLLLQNPEIKAYIQGNVGDGVSPGGPVQLNGKLVPVKTLMNARAKAIYNFLLGQGVPAVQLQYGPGKINDGAHYDLTITVTNGKKP